MVLRKGRLGQREVDFSPVRGAAAISLTTRLTMESFSLARLDSVPGSREDIAIRFVLDARSGCGVRLAFVELASLAKPPASAELAAPAKPLLTTS
jgi:hypothetical protein